MLSDREQRALEDLERSLADGDELPPVGRPARWRVSIRHWPWVWAAGLVIGSISVFLMVEGAGSGGLALALAGISSWLLWHYWPQLREQGDPALLREDDGAGGGSVPRRPADRAAGHSIPRRRTDS